jgi:hypothetical protein
VRRARAVFALVVLASFAAACGGSGTDWNAYNRGRSGWDDAAIAEARSVAAKIDRAGLGCDDFGIEPFSAYQKTYAKGKTNVPIALASGQCDVKPQNENVILAVFDDGKPTAADYIDAKRDLLCERLEKNKLPGPAYIDKAGAKWVLEPDTFKESRVLAAKLGGKVHDLCPKATVAAQKINVTIP